MSTHALISYVKSATRLIGFFLLAIYIPSGCIVLAAAEVVGIVEEFFE